MDSKPAHYAVLGTNGSGKSALACYLAEHASRPTAFISLETQYAVIEEERYNDDSDLLNIVDSGRSALEYILEAGPVTAEIQALFGTLRMESILERGIKYLSTGEFRKVLICRALTESPRRLILDEPFDGLDARSQEDLKALLNHLAQSGIEIILLVNRLGEIIEAIEEVVLLGDSGILLAAPKAEALASESLQRLLKMHELPENLPALAGNGTPALKPDAPLIDMKNVRVAYNGISVLQELNWRVAPKQHYQISGPNGCGKTTLLELVTGDNPQVYANEVSLFGRRRGSGESIWEIKKHIGHISAALQLNYRVSISALATIVSGFHDSIGLYEKPAPAEIACAREWLKILHLSHKAKKPLRSLSYGEQRLVLIARAMVKQPPLLILDEPCQGLDEINRRTILELIDQIGRKTGTTLLYVSHHADDQIPCIKHQLTLPKLERRPDESPVSV
jgi:molybdate transport system ATP-binding protein